MIITGNQKTGLIQALIAFSIWGVCPVYFKALQHVSAMELLCQRAVWSLPILVILVLFRGELGAIRPSLAVPKVLATLFLTTVLMACNSFVFIYAVVSGQVLQASLGYFINPLVNVFLGMIILRERLRPLQILAVILAGAGTVNLTVHYGALPWISLTLAFCFGFYGLFRKTIQIDPLTGLLVEGILIFPFTMAYLIYLAYSNGIAFGAVDWQTTGLLMFAGLVNTVPLLAFITAARRLRYTTIGLCQYLGPSLHFILAIFVYREIFGPAHLVTFSLIWTGLIIFMIDSFKQAQTALPQT